MKFVVRPARRGLLKRKQSRPVLIASNGEPMFTGETYNNVDDAIDACYAVINAISAGKIEVEVRD